MTTPKLVNQTFKKNNPSLRKYSNFNQINLFRPKKLIFDGHTKTQSNTHQKDGSKVNGLEKSGARLNYKENMSGWRV